MKLRKEIILPQETGKLLLKSIKIIEISFFLNNVIMLVMKTFFIFILLLSSLSFANTKNYQCPVSEKYDASGNIYTQDMMKKYKYSVNVIDTGDSAILQRCSFSSSAGGVTCDSYVTDYVHRDPNIDSVKYYYFAGSFDIQIIAGSLFIENNGRGGIAFGNCEDKN
jgi:hypothetical protein